MVLNLLSLSQHIQRETQRENPFTKSKRSKGNNSPNKDTIIKSYYDRSDDDDETASICSFDDYDDLDSFCGSSSVLTKDSRRRSQSSRGSSTSTSSMIKLLPQEDLLADDDDDQSEISLYDMSLFQEDQRRGSSSSSLKDCSFRPQDSYIGLLEEGDLLALDLSSQEHKSDEDLKKSRQKKSSNNAFRVAFQLRKKPIGTIMGAVMEDTTFGRNINFLQRKVSAICGRKQK